MKLLALLLLTLAPPLWAQSPIRTVKQTSTASTGGVAAGAYSVTFIQPAGSLLGVNIVNSAGQNKLIDYDAAKFPVLTFFDRSGGRQPAMTYSQDGAGTIRVIEIR